jgi:hypothetical protein
LAKPHRVVLADASRSFSSKSPNFNGLMAETTWVQISVGEFATFLKKE